MKQMTIKILEKGDAVESYHPDQLIIRKKNGDFCVYEIVEDEDGYPMLNEEKVIKITQGRGSIEMFDPDTQITIRR